MLQRGGRRTAQRNWTWGRRTAGSCSASGVQAAQLGEAHTLASDWDREPADMLLTLAGSLHMEDAGLCRIRKQLCSQVA